MILTNKLNLPQSIVSAVMKDEYNKGDAEISVTGLLKPPRQAVLEKQYQNEITEDVSTRMWSLLGQSVHTILERANRTAIAERRLSMEIEGWQVSGGMDLYEEDNTLIDYKITSVHKLLQGDLEDWARQLNSYAVLLRHHGHEAKKLQVVAILRDWSKMEAKRNPDYPQAQVVNISIPLWEPDKAIAFMRERVILHQQARVKLPECTPEERWTRPDVWAVMKLGRKSAVKLCPNQTEALEMACTDKKLYVAHRPGMSVRCESYCGVLPFCTEGQKHIQSNSHKENVDAIHATA